MPTNDKQFYAKLCGRELSSQEVFEAKSNLVGFFDLLFRIDERLSEKKLPDKQTSHRNSEVVASGSGLLRNFPENPRATT